MMKMIGELMPYVSHRNTVKLNYVLTLNFKCTGQPTYGYVTYKYIKIL